MNGIRYEPVFGDQRLFNGAPDDAVYVRYGRDIFIFSSEINFTVGPLRDIPIVAMRRIIRTPVWTKADYDAGKLPEVGAEIDGGTVVFVNSFNIVVELDSGAVIVSSPKTFLAVHKPIETDAERQQRGRDEWCKSAVGYFAEKPSENYFDSMGRVYEAMQSGELKMPEVKK